MKKVNVALVGATGMVGRTFIKVLEERNFPINNIYMFSSAKSAGTTVKFAGKDVVVEELTETSFDNKDIQIALFSAGGSTSAKFAPIAASKGIIVVDNSSQWRMDPEVPLVVPEVNPEEVKNHKGIIANPNCSTIQAMVPLKPLHDKYGLKRVVYSTYQAVSGSGVRGLKDLEDGIKGELNTFYPHPIAFNCLPHIDVFEENGYTKEEMKMVNETKKIFNKDIEVNATCVRVPVLRGHSESIYIETKKPIDMDKVFELLGNSTGIDLCDDLANQVYPMPTSFIGDELTHVGRVRKDLYKDNALSLWITGDQLMKGAAYNSVDIGLKMIELGLLK